MNKKMGRPKVNEEDKLVNISLTVTPEQKLFLDRFPNYSRTVRFLVKNLEDQLDSGVLKLDQFIGAVQGLEKERKG